MKTFENVHTAMIVVQLTVFAAIMIWLSTTFDVKPSDTYAKITSIDQSLAAELALQREILESLSSKLDQTILWIKHDHELMEDARAEQVLEQFK